MAEHPARDHHFVPKLLLKPWLTEGPQRQFSLHGYWWDGKKGELRCKKRGVNSFCFQVDLLSLKSHALGRDAIERLFFGEIDRIGADVRNILLEHGPARLTEVQRCDFARLLLSLDARRPVNVEKLRKEVTRYLANELDADSEIRAAMDEHGIKDSPSDYVDRQMGWFLEDRALSMIQMLVDNPKVGKRLINAEWGLKRLGPHDGSFVLSDRPLIRIHAYESPGATWVLPLTPTVAFVAANHKANLDRLLRCTGQRFAKLTNVSSAKQAERFVFSTEQNDERWLGKYLRHTQ